MATQFKNLIFEGGGIKGIAYIGAMQVLAQHGYLNQITRVGGASVGALNALIYALGYQIDEQQDIIRSSEFKKCMDNSFGFLRDFKRLWFEFGWNRGDYLYDWAGDLIATKLGDPKATFADLKKSGGSDLYVIGTNLSTGFSELFSYERHATMPLVDAIRISVSIPLFYRAVRYGKRQDVYVDGGVLINYPVKIFDRLKYIDLPHDSAAIRKTDYYERENVRFLKARPGHSPYIYNRQTLGFRLDTTEEIGLFRYNEKRNGKRIKTFPSFFKALLSAIIQSQENMHLHSDDWQRTLYINTLDVKALDFNLSEKKKKELVLQGIKGAETYLRWFEDQKEDPTNRVNQLHPYS